MGTAVTGRAWGGVAERGAQRTMTQRRFTHAGSVRVSLGEQQWDTVQCGQLINPAGVRFERRSTRLKRAQADALIAAGAPLILYWYGGRQLDYFDGSDAVQQWRAVRPVVTTQAPQLGGGVVWSGGRWVSDEDQEVLVLTGRC